MFQIWGMKTGFENEEHCLNKFYMNILFCINNFQTCTQICTTIVLEQQGVPTINTKVLNNKYLCRLGTYFDNIATVANIEIK